MFQANEDSIVKSLETIAKCMLKQNKMAEETIKKTQELYKANMAMIKEGQKEHFPQGVELLKDLDGT